MSHRSERKRKLERYIESRHASFRMYLDFRFPMPYRFRNEMKIIAKGLAMAAFELNPKLRAAPGREKEGSNGSL